jgi:hypothetical protein
VGSVLGVRIRPVERRPHHRALVNGDPWRNEVSVLACEAAMSNIWSMSGSFAGKPILSRPVAAASPKLL